MLARLEIDRPMSIECQRDLLLAAVESEQDSFVRSEDVERIDYLKRCCITDSQLQPYDITNIKEARNRLDERLRKRRE